MGSLGNQMFRVYEVSTRLPRVSSTLQEVEILPTLFFFFILRAFWLSFNTLRGCLALFFPKGLFSKLMGYGISVMF